MRYISSQEAKDLIDDVQRIFDGEPLAGQPCTLTVIEKITSDYTDTNRNTLLTKMKNVNDSYKTAAFFTKLLATKEPYGVRKWLSASLVFLKWRLSDLITIKKSWGEEKWSSVMCDDIKTQIIRNASDTKVFCALGIQIDWNLVKNILMSSNSSSTSTVVTQVAEYLRSDAAINDAVDWSQVQKLCFQGVKLPFIRNIYDHRLKPTPQAWVDVLYIRDEDMGDDRFFEDEAGEKQVYCMECNFNEDEDEYQDKGCTCNLHEKTAVFVWLMKNNVPIPDEFWHKVAYFNLYQLVRQLFANKPPRYNLSIPPYAFKVAIENDSHHFMKFVARKMNIDVDSLRPFTKISRHMQAILDIENERVFGYRQLLAIVDDYKTDMPDNTYIEITRNLKRKYDEVNV